MFMAGLAFLPAQKQHPGDTIPAVQDELHSSESKLGKDRSCDKQTREKRGCDKQTIARERQELL